MQLDGLVGVVAGGPAHALDDVPDGRERPRPRSVVERSAGPGRVANLRRKAEVERVALARAVQDAPAAMPPFEQPLPARAIGASRNVLDEHARCAIDVRTAFAQKAERVAHLRVDAVRGHDEIAAEALPI